MTEIQNQKDKWFQINEEGLKIFNDILHSLIAFHEMIHGNTKVSDETWIFKKKLIESINPLVAIKKFGDYEYLVFAKIKDKFNSWIHIDGIQMERIELKKIGNTSHEVFKITCLTDIFDRFTIPSKIDFDTEV